jgi:hypothetical protein
MCCTAFWARLIMPTMFTMKVFSRRSRGISQKFSTASPCRQALHYIDLQAINTQAFTTHRTSATGGVTLPHGQSGNYRTRHQSCRCAFCAAVARHMHTAACNAVCRRGPHLHGSIVDKDVNAAELPHGFVHHLSAHAVKRSDANIFTTYITLPELG